MELSPQQRNTLLDLAYRAISDYVTARHIQAVQPSDPQLVQCAGAFVTLNRQGELRGCLGHTQADLSLCEVVQQMAIAAATRDPRFYPLQAEELDDLEIEISVLSPLQRITDIAHVEVGKHGLVISKGGCRGLLLPQVATEHGMDRVAFADAVCWKAGLPPGSWRQGAKLYTFTALVFGAHYKDHVRVDQMGAAKVEHCDGA